MGCIHRPYGKDGTGAMGWIRYMVNIIKFFKAIHDLHVHFNKENENCNFYKRPNIQVFAFYKSRFHVQNFCFFTSLVPTRSA